MDISFGMKSGWVGWVLMARRRWVRLMERRSRRNRESRWSRGENRREGESSITTH